LYVALVIRKPTKYSLLGAEQTGHTSDVHCIAGSKDSAKVIGGAQDGSVKFWDASTLKVTASFQYHNGPRVPACTAAVFSGDGELTIQRDIFCT